MSILRMKLPSAPSSMSSKLKPSLLRLKAALLWLKSSSIFNHLFKTCTDVPVRAQDGGQARQVKAPQRFTLVNEKPPAFMQVDRSCADPGLVEWDVTQKSHSWKRAPGRQSTEFMCITMTHRSGATKDRISHKVQSQHEPCKWLVFQW